MVDNLKIIGEGAYGVVYSGTINDKEYALKRNLIDQQIDFIGSIRELDILLRLPHPNIVQLKKVLYNNPFKNIKIKNQEYDTKDDYIHFAFEKGMYDLHRLIYRYSSTFDFLRNVCADVLLGLEFAHSREIIHRDMKPSNILIFKEKNQDNDEYTYVSKICDFGLSKPFTYQGKQSPKVVTSCYRPPEILSNKSYDKKIDMWSVGCMIFEMFSKRRFSDSTKENDIKEDIDTMFELDKNGQFQYISFIQDKYPREQISQLLSHLLVINPEERYSATEALNHSFFDEIREYIDDVRKNHPLRPPSNVVFKCIDCQNRKIGVEFFSNALQKYSSHDWYRHRTFFLAIDLFDRWLIWNNIQKEKQSSMSKELIEFYCYICLYMSIKYFVSISVTPPFSKIAPKKYTTAEYRKLAIDFEKHMIKNVLNYCIYRRTIYESVDNMDKILNSNDVQKILTKILYEPEKIQNLKINQIAQNIIEDK